MCQLCFKRHRLPADIIRHSAWLYARLTLELPRCRGEAYRAGPGQSYETLRRWFLKFGPVIAANPRRACPRPGDRWRLDEMVIVIRRKRTWLWRALDHEGEVPDFLVQRRHDAKAARRLKIYVTVLISRVKLM